MILTLNLPDFILARLGDEAGRVEQASLRTFVCGLYREGLVSAPEAMQALGLSARVAFDELIADHRAQRDWTEDEVADELATIERLNR